MDIPEGDIRMFVTLVARAIEMHLSEDRTRQQSARPGEPLDTAEDLHVEIFPLAWPEDFEALMAGTREHRGVAVSADRRSSPMGPSNHLGRAGWLRKSG